MSDQTVAEKLAAVRCDAAPWGWSDHDSDGMEIVEFMEDESGNVGTDRKKGFAAIVRGHGGVFLGKSYWPTGVVDSGVGGSLVPLPAPSEPIDKKSAGIYRKYNVSRVDGTDSPGGKHENCRLFVLDVEHDPHARVAALAYAESCRSEFPQLSAELSTWASCEHDWFRTYHNLGAFDRVCRKCGAVEDIVTPPVPLPAPTPEPERLSDQQLEWIVTQDLKPTVTAARSEVVSMAIELIEARKTIADQAAEIERLKTQVDCLSDNIELSEQKVADLNTENNDALNAFRLDQITKRKLIAERDAAIDIARRMRDDIIHRVVKGRQWESVVECDAKYGADPTCSNTTHKFSHCDCEFPTPIDRPCAPLPITEPLDPIDDPANTNRAYQSRTNHPIQFFTLGGVQSRGGKTYRAIDTLWVDESTIEPWTGGAQ